MLISEILNEDELNEKPVGLLKRGMYKLGSKLGSSRAVARGEVAKEANLLKREFRAWGAGFGVKPNEVDPKILQQFLDNTGYGDIGKKIIASMTKKLKQRQRSPAASIAGLGTSSAKVTFNNEQVDQILLQVVQAGFQQVGGSKRKGRFATDTTPAKSRKKAATPGSAPQLDPQAAMQALQQMGYTVIPPGGTP